MQELFENSHKFKLDEFLPSLSDLRFLDIACAPGGFSQYLLDHFPTSQGYGITLPEALGGFPIHVEAYPPSRFKLCHFDLLSHPMHTNPTLDVQINLVIGDAQYLPRTQEAIHEYRGRKAGTVTGGRLALLLKEFVLGLQVLQEGGVFIFRFVVWERVHSNIIRLFFLCFDLFDSVKPFKSEYQHTADCTFYAVCSGFRRNKYTQLDVKTLLDVAYARVVLSPPFAAVHNGTINCFKVIEIETENGEIEPEPSMDKPDAHILENLYPFRDMRRHPFFTETCQMFEYVYKMFLVGQSSYTDHYRV